MSNLPPISTVELNHEGKSLWPLILRAEEAALAEATKAGAPKAGTPKYTDNLIGARVVGFLLQDLWKHQSHSFGLIPYKYLVRDISLCFSVPGVGVGTEAEAQAQYTAIYKLGLFYRNHLMRVFRSDGGPVPTASHHPSRPSMEQVRERIIKEMQTPTTEPDARRHTLIRDGYRCVLTGAYDSDSCDKYPDLDARATAEQANVTNTQCAHIFSESAQDGDKAEYAASAMVILKMFGLTDKAESLVGGNVNKHFNTFTMAANLHYFFDHLKFWLEEVIGEPNTYDVCAAKPSFFTRTVGPPHRRVTFKVDPDVEAACRANNKPVPALPSPTLLAIRAACSRVAHMSGAAEQIDQVLRDLEDTRIMAEDGSTVDLLTSRLLQSPHSVRITA
ncbi:hypothetical protein B0H14DRAFT_2797962 [Mycena olivaceomarginata]|nr:hypothetical protein B0H14DRAFT_2797962 [Mycena olivaceomarginata]